MHPRPTTFHNDPQILKVWRPAFSLTHRPFICSTASTSVVSQPSSVDQQVMDQDGDCAHISPQPQTGDHQNSLLQVPGT